MKKSEAYQHPRLLEKPIVVYTAGKNGLRCMLILRQLGVEALAFADGSPAKQGTKIGGVPVFSIEELVDKYGNDVRYIVASTIYWNETNVKLRELGITEENILTEKIEQFAITGEVLRPVFLNDASRKKLQNLFLEMMEFVHKICEENNINYYLYGGTLLGAVRHKGFIPWDDDVDLCMMRDDYNRFFKAAEKELGERFKINHTSSGKRIIRDNICIMNTTWLAWDSPQSKATEISIDIMPMDYVEIKEGFFVKLQDILPRKFLLITKTEPVHNIFRRFLQLILPRKVISKFVIWLVKLRNNKRRKYVHYFCGEYGYRAARTFPTEWFDEKILAEFEGRKYYIPKDYDKVLTAMYGSDYMKIPPEGKREIHPRSLLDFGDGEILN
jgi:lipopolysaccharide cholinephosphotransferase